MRPPSQATLAKRACAMAKGMACPEAVLAASYKVVRLCPHGLAWGDCTYLPAWVIAMALAVIKAEKGIRN